MDTGNLPWNSNVIRERVGQAIARQREVPASPGAVVDGEPLLCLAACAAEAGFLALGDSEAATAFRRTAASATDKSVLYEAFDRLGWPPEACTAALQFNDAQSPAVRKQRILDVLGRTAG